METVAELPAEVAEDEAGERLAEGVDVVRGQRVDVAEVGLDEGEALGRAEMAALDAVPVVLAGGLEAGGVEEAEDGERRGVELGGDAEPVGLGVGAVGRAGRRAGRRWGRLTGGGGSPSG